MPGASGSEREIWDRHWRRLDGESAIFGRLASLVRRRILAPAVRHYLDRYFAADGLFVELGCGTGQASQLETAARRRRFALDLSLPALVTARRSSTYNAAVAGDLRSLPFADASIAGVWNLGVMEHFERPEGLQILTEVRRILEPGGVAVLFWPPEFGFSRWLLAPIEWWRSRGDREAFHFFPAEVNRLDSRAHAREALRAAGFEPIALHFSLRDAFIHLVVVGRKSGEP